MYQITFPLKFDPPYHETTACIFTECSGGILQLFSPATTKSLESASKLTAIASRRSKYLLSEFELGMCPFWFEDLKRTRRQRRQAVQ